MALMTLHNVTLGYENTVAAENVSARIEAGDYVAVLGANGSGKSTLIKGMLGLLRPRRGTIELGDGLTRDQIGYLPQQTPAQKDFPASVFEVALSGRLNKLRQFLPFYMREDKRLAMKALERMGVADLKDVSFRALSGGQQQRVLLARALLSASRLLLLDEPATALDPQATGEFYAILRGLNREQGVAVVMVSHDVAAALRDANKVLLMDTAVSFFGTVDEYLREHPAVNGFAQRKGDAKRV